MNAPQYHDQKKGEITRSRIMAAAREVFYEKGFFTASVDEIARRSALSRATVYLYFKSKNEILLDLLKEDLEYQICKYEDLMKINRLNIRSVENWLIQFCSYISEKNESLGLFWAAGALRSSRQDMAGIHRDNVIALLGGRFKGFDLDALDRPSREIQNAKCHMMLYLIEGVSMNFTDLHTTKLNIGTKILAPMLMEFLISGNILDAARLPTSSLAGPVRRMRRRRRDGVSSP